MYCLKIIIYRSLNLFDKYVKYLIMSLIDCRACILHGKRLMGFSWYREYSNILYADTAEYITFSSNINTYVYSKSVLWNIYKR